jgi:lipopolysaccharide/colanic/teichoic acid biosynthesis glycosyltransferase
MKRAFDIALSLLALLAMGPLLALIALLKGLEDLSSPFYIGRRVACGGGVFGMVKFRSMHPDAWKTGVNSTSVNDGRITPFGRFLRRYKLDELPQLWNVLKGDMSLVGPRPQVETDASMYTAEERRMLNARPGITDLASIVFSDEGDILRDAADPDLLYNQKIRPWKSRLALLWLDRRTFWIDLKILGLTAIALVSRHRALRGVARILKTWDADETLRRIAYRRTPLAEGIPPGAREIVREYARGA